MRGGQLGRQPDWPERVRELTGGGVDAAAKEEIHRILRESTATGLAMLVSSSEYDELLGLCDRILVAFRGRLVASLPVDEADQATIARYAGGYS